jgi:hypothetical protein
VVDEESNSTAKNFYKGVDEKQNKTLNKMLERNCTREYSIKFTLPNEDKAVLPKALMEIVGDYEYPARELSEGAKEWSKKKKPLSAIEASTGRALNNKNLKSQVDRN